MIFWHGFFFLSALSVVNGKMFLINTEDKGAKKTAPKKNVSNAGSYPVATSADESETSDEAQEMQETKNPVLPRILGGTKFFDSTDYGWKVSMNITGPNRRSTLCVGSIVDNLNILTAASCLQKGGHVASTDQVTVFTDSNKAWQGRKLKLDSIEIHPGFVEGAATNDLAVIKVSPGELDFNTSACLPRRPIRDYIGRYFHIGGFGRVNKKGFKIKNYQDQEFQIANITLPDLPDQCVEKSQQGRDNTDRDDANDISMNVNGKEGVFCTRNKVSCYGDGGGPIFTLEKKCRTNILHGIARNVHSPDKPCDDDPTPGKDDEASLHTSIFYHLYKEESWLCKTLGYRECKGVSVYKDRQPDWDPDLE